MECHLDFVSEVYSTCMIINKLVCNFRANWGKTKKKSISDWCSTFVSQSVEKSRPMQFFDITFAGLTMIL